MLTKIRKLLFFFESENIFSFYSAVFRIFICFHILKKIFLQWDFFDTLYKGNSFFVPDNSQLESLGINGDFIRQHFDIYLFIYLTLIILFLFGIGRNFTALGVFICLEIQQRLCYTILNGGDNLFKFVVLYMIFINSYEFFVLIKRKKANPNIYNLISNLATYSICIHLCLVYFISAIHKIHADVWFNGVANYYILSSERFRGTSINSELAKNGIFVTITTYFTIAVELFYPILVWIKKTRAIMIISALILHIGIYIFMMIYDFQIVFIVVQGFFIPNKTWLYWYATLGQKLNFQKKNEIRQN